MNVTGDRGTVPSACPSHHLHTHPVTGGAPSAADHPCAAPPDPALSAT